MRRTWAANEVGLQRLDGAGEGREVASWFWLTVGDGWAEHATPNEARGLPLADRVLKVKRIFRVSYRTVLYRLSERDVYGKGIWQQFQYAYKARFGQSLLKSDEPAAVSPEDFSVAMVELRTADEPKRLSSEDFVEDRLSRLVRSALEKELISVSRAAEILDLDLKTMRAVIATWGE